MTIREASLSDLNDLLAIEQECFSIDCSFNKRQLKYQTLSKHCKVFVVSIDGVIAGYASLLFNSRTKNSRLYSLAVSNSYRNRGISSKLLKECIEVSIAMKKSLITLEVMETNGSAIGLYTNHGFTVLKTIKDYYGMGNNCIYMVKNI